MQPIINVIKQNKFTPQNLNDYKQLVPQAAYPELYGADLPPQIRYTYTDLIDIDRLEKTPYGFVQKYRAGDKNKKYDEIQRGISRNGFKLKYPAIAVFRAKNGDLHIITGYTRTDILERHCGFTNVIASIYEGVDGYTKEEIEDAVSRCGIRFNTIHDEASTAEIQDVYRETESAIMLGWIEPTLTDITKRVEEVCGNGVFTDRTRSRLVYEIFNNHNPDQTVVAYDKGKSKDFLTRNKFLNGNGVRYITYTTENQPKVLCAILDTAFNFPNDEIRIILHTGTLEGKGSLDLERCFFDRVNGFKEFYESKLKSFSIVYFDGKLPSMSRVKLYGVLPSLSAIHDLDKLVFFAEDGTLYQKEVKKAA